MARTTVYLDEELLARARRFIPGRGLSQLINELLAGRIAELEHEELQAQMREGYIATRDERRMLNEDWEIVDAEDWPS